MYFLKVYTKTAHPAAKPAAGRGNNNGEKGKMICVS